MKFKEWDRVQVNSKAENIFNHKGTILGKDCFNCYMIRTDEKNCFRHGCDGLCEEGHGLYIIPDQHTKITLITNKEETA